MFRGAVFFRHGVYYESLASNVRSTNTAVEVNHTFSYYAQYSAR